jgi:UDP-N-acetylmuramoylalanine--D-glutamate ligase
VSSAFAGRRVVVAGVATSGVAAAEALLDRGARVVAVDGRDGEREQAAAERLRARGARVRLGDAATPVPSDLVVTSPGWRPDQPLLAAALAAGVEVVGEPELAWRLAQESAATRAVPWLGVTGTNGKTTTVGMLESILRAAGLRAVAAGNVGRPLVSAVLEEPAYDVLAVELSSFQLHWSRHLRCTAAVVLNLAEDHLDWHGGMAAYAAAKARIWSRSTCAVVPADDPLVRSLADGLVDRHLFGLDPPGPGGYGVRDGEIVERAGDEETVLAAVDVVALPGRHNVANAVAAAALGRLLGRRGAPAVAAEHVAAGLRAFAPGRHRNEVVASAGGVRWVDDSKATNPHAAAASLAAYPRVVWIAGGLFKGADVGDLVAAHATRLRAVVVIGVDRTPLLEAMARHAPDVPVVEVAGRDTGVMDDAVTAAARLAAPGDVVLLAPAAASMDQFRDYAERGDAFAAAARRVAG